MKTKLSESSSVRVALNVVVEAMEPRLFLSGELDPTFGIGGRTTADTRIVALDNTVVVQSNGKVVSGAVNFSDQSARLVGFSADGTVDLSFGVNGYASFGFGSNGSRITDLAVQPDGKIVAVGYTYTEPDRHGSIFPDQLTVARFNANGTADATFARVSTYVGGMRAISTAVVIQPDNKIVVSATKLQLILVDEDRAQGGVVIRLNTSGALDTSFGGTGIVSLPTDVDAEQRAGAIALLNNGRIGVAGSSYSFDLNGRYREGGQLTVLQSNGDVDATFGGGDGTVSLHDLSTGSVSGLTTLFYDPQLSKIVVGGGQTVGRLNNSGALDTTFGTAGRYVLGPQSTFVESGSFTAGGNYAFLFNEVRRFDDYVPVLYEIKPDTTSVFSTTLPSGVDPAEDIALAPGNKLVLVAGRAVSRILDVSSTLTIDGTNSNDVITFNGNSYTVNGVTSPVDVNNTTKLVINGLAGDDRITITATPAGLPVFVFGSAGNDTIAGGPGNESLDGGDGNDSITGGAGNDTVLGQAGVDTLLGGDGNDYVAGYTQTDYLTGGAGDDTMFGGSGNDFYNFGLAGSLENDVVNEQGDGGLDTIDFSTITAGVSINLTTDVIASHFNRVVRVQYTNTGGNFENATGGSGNDTLLGNGRDNVLNGRGGNDSLVGLLGNDTLLGETGTDYLTGGYGSDLLVGGSGNDFYNFADPTTGGSEYDVLVEADGGGTDTIDFSAVTTGVHIDLTASGSNSFYLALGYRRALAGIGYSNIENATGGSGSDTIEGSAKNNVLNGRAGNDQLLGQGGNDLLIGETGDDFLYGVTGNTTMIGGSGNDEYLLPNSNIPPTCTVDERPGGGIDTLNFGALDAGVTVNLNADIVLASARNLLVKTSAPGLASNFENVYGGYAADFIRGNAKNNLIIGNGGNDTLLGLVGNDTLYGNAGSDWLQGGEGNDLLYGADGAKDTLDGGSGVDSLGSADAVDVRISVP